MNELESLVALSLIPLLGPVKIRLLIRTFGSAAKALKAKKEDLESIPGFSQKLSANWQAVVDEARCEKEMKLAERLEAKILSFMDPQYPRRLLGLSDAPILLYVMGDWQQEDNQGIAVVGTRQASIYGLEMAKKFGCDLAGRGVTVVSGLARGVDTAAHIGALQKGRTIAVIGSGLANIYPHENRLLAQQICNKGALISEFPMTTPPDRHNFPQRNRIVSGMTRGTLLIEAPLKSGAMITMRKAREQGRELYALPGRADGEHFSGNHRLIKEGIASLVENVQDILGHDLDLFKCFPETVKKRTPDLGQEELEFYNILPEQEISMEALQRLTQLPSGRLNVLLMSLQLKQLVKEYPGKLYKKI